jgi:hypothetical protein
MFSNIICFCRGKMTISIKITTSDHCGVLPFRSRVLDPSDRPSAMFNRHVNQRLDSPSIPFLTNLTLGCSLFFKPFTEKSVLSILNGSSLALCTKKISGPLLKSSPQKKTLESTRNFLHKTYFLNMIFSINFTLKSWVFPSQLRIFFWNVY